MALFGLVSGRLERLLSIVQVLCFILRWDDEVGSELWIFPEAWCWFMTPCKSVTFGVCGSEN